MLYRTVFRNITEALWACLLEAEALSLCLVGAKSNAALVGGAFAYADATAANMRRKEDGWNGAVGGCAAGLVVGAACTYHTLLI